MTSVLYSIWCEPVYHIFLVGVVTLAPAVWRIYFCCSLMLYVLRILPRIQDAAFEVELHTKITSIQTYRNSAILFATTVDANGLSGRMIL